jgi:hypothetical protein
LKGLSGRFAAYHRRTNAEIDIGVALNHTQRGTIQPAKKSKSTG